MKDRRVTMAVLVAILVVGAILRVWGIDFGLPYTYHIDEGFEVNRALQLASGSFDFSRVGKGGYFYVLFVEFGIFFVLAKLFGAVDSARDFALWFIRDPSWFYLIGRFTTAVLGTLSIWIVFRIGRKLHSPLAGCLAALFTAVNVLHVQHSHYITVDMPLTVAGLFALWFMIDVYETGARRSYLLAAVFAGVAAMCKMPGVILLGPFYLAHVLGSRRQGASWAATMVGPQWLAAFGLFWLVYIIGAPGLLIYAWEIPRWIMGLYGMKAAVAEPATVIAASAWEFRPFEFYNAVALKSFGWPLLVLSLVGAVWALLLRRWSVIIALSYGLLFYLALGFSAKPSLAFDRYILPYVPLMAISAALALCWIRDVLVRRLSTVTEHQTQPAVWILAGLLALPGLAQSASDNLALQQTDPRTIAREWVVENIPGDRSILIEGFSAQTFNGTIPLNNSLENSRQRIVEFKENGEQGKAKYFTLEAEAYQGPRHDLRFYIWDNLEMPSDYAAEGIDYMVVRPKALTVSPKYGAQGQAFYAALRESPDYKLEISFGGDPVTSLDKNHPIREDGEGADSMTYIEIWKRVGLR